MTAAKLPIIIGAIPEQGAAVLLGPGPMARGPVGQWLTSEHIGNDEYVLKQFDDSDDPPQPDALVVAGRGKSTRYGAFALLEQRGCRFFHPGGMASTSPDNKIALYVITKMMWDSDQNPNAVVDNCLRHYYQEARDAMYDYYRYLNDLAVKQSAKHSDTVFEPVVVKGAAPT